MWVGKERVQMAAVGERALDLSFLDHKERRSVRKVLERDKRLRMIEAERMGRLFPEGKVEVVEKNMLPLRTQTIWSTSASLTLPEANPPTLKTSLTPNTEANAGSHNGKIEDISFRARKPNLRSRISSLLSIKFLQRSNRDTSSRNTYRETNSSSSRETHINIVDMNIRNSNTDMDHSRDTHIHHGSRHMDGGTVDELINSGSTDTRRGVWNVSIENEDTSRTHDMHVSTDNRVTSSSKDVHISSCTDSSSSSNRSSSGPPEVNDHAVCQEKQPIIKKTTEAKQKDQIDKQTESSFQRTDPHTRTTTDQPQTVQHDRPSSQISKPINSDWSPGSFLPRAEALPAGIGDGQQPAMPSVELRASHGKVKRLEPWVSGQQSTDGHQEAMDQVQSKASTFFDTKLRYKDSFSCIPEPSEEEHPLPGGIDTTEESLNFPKDLSSEGTSDMNEDSCEPNSSIQLSDTYQGSMPLSSANKNKKEASDHTSSGTDTEHSTHPFSNKCPINNTSGIYLIQQSGFIKEDNGVEPVADASMSSTPKSPKEDKLFTVMSSFRASTKQIIYTASQTTEIVETTTEHLVQPTRANSFTTEVLLSTDQRIPVWKSHLSHGHSYLDQAHSPTPSSPSQGPSRDHQHANPRINSYPAPSDSWNFSKVAHHPAGGCLMKAQSCEMVLQKKTCADSPACLPSPPGSALRSMSSSERIHILAKRHANALKPGRELGELKGPQVSHNQTWGRCNSTYEINASQHSQIPFNLIGEDNLQLSHKHRSLTVSNLSLPQQRLSIDKYSQQSKLSVFPTSYSGQSQPDKKLHLRSHDNLSQESTYNNNTLNNINTNPDPVPIKKKRECPPYMSMSQVDLNEHVDFTDIPHKVSSPKWHVTRNQNQTHTRPRDFLLDSTGSQISLDCSSGDTDEDIFSTSPPGQCRQESSPYYLTAYDKALKPHHRSSSNVYQANGNQAPAYSRGSLGLTQRRSVSVSNVSTNRAARPRQISAGSRTVTLANLRDLKDFEEKSVSPKPSLFYSLDQTATSEQIEQFTTTGTHIKPFHSSNYYLTYVESEDSDSDTASEGEYYLYGQGENLESPL